MRAVDGEEAETPRSVTQDEKIFVSVRLRPLNEKEIGRNDVSDWECISNTTIIYKNTLPERSMLPSAYSFDRVFGCGCSTQQVYEEGAKEVALSVVSGINSSIFAYGQTSSGKTYTMSGITEYAVEDIYDYIERHKDREFMLKFSAIEIYNEAVRDLLSSDTTPLRLLDDPERGTVVEKLTEETLRDLSHLQELLSICDAQRQIGETSLNETSSRSHQILRLSVESSAREFLRADNISTLSATVDFVDLAGSERASQTLSAGARLKEGCHINRSLLTLGTVIRKLSKGRNGHIPYRDSKLTRILQSSLGGNARTAIICTMSPARTHVEQSRNTLLFASCAKDVSTSAQVNLVMSDKALVKHLRRELARLENALRGTGSTSVTGDSTMLLNEKEILIEQMDKKIKELILQRDLAQSQIEDLLRSVGEDRVSKLLSYSDQLLDSQVQSTWLDDYSASEVSEVTDPRLLEVDLKLSNVSQYSDRRKGLHSNKDLQFPENSEDTFLQDSLQRSLSIPKSVGRDTSQGWKKTQKTDADSEDICKEVQCIDTEESVMKRKVEADACSVGPEEREKLSPHKEDNDLDYTYAALKQKILDMQKTIDCLVSLYPAEKSPYSSDADMSSSRSMKLTRSRSCKAILMSFPSPPWFEKDAHDEYTPPNGFEKEFQLKLSELKYGADTGKLSRKPSQTSLIGESMDDKAENMKISAEGDVNSTDNVGQGGKEMEEHKSEKQYGDDSVVATEQKKEKLGIKANEDGLDTMQVASKTPATDWALEFQRQQKQIIELWDACNVPLVHRTYFVLLFKGEPSDNVYLEVELRRLSFLKDAFAQGTKTVNGGQTLTLASSIRTLNREREMLSKQMQKIFTEKEREGLYKKWGIGLGSKQRRVQLARRIWTDTKDMDHIKESASVVSKLVGFIEPSQAPKEMFGLSFTPRGLSQRSQSWKHSMSSLF